jgi:hypothetical protein
MSNLHRLFNLRSSDTTVFAEGGLELDILYNSIFTGEFFEFVRQVRRGNDCVVSSLTR